MVELWLVLLILDKEGYSTPQITLKTIIKQLKQYGIRSKGRGVFYKLFIETKLRFYMVLKWVPVVEIVTYSF